MPGNLWEKGLVLSALDDEGEGLIHEDRHVAQIDKPSPLADLLASARSFILAPMADDLPNEDYVRAFLEPFGADIGRAVLWGIPPGPGFRSRTSFPGPFGGAEGWQAWGLVNHVVPADDLICRAEAMAVQMLTGVPAAQAAYKELLNLEIDLSFTEALRIERTRSQTASACVSAADLNHRLGRLRSRG